ncbi:glycosyl transferase, group 2 family protein [Aggregatibacter actinomycetemcomitans serotype e str. SC1083]|uniref:Glycosyl transferase, group 2 family protein n=1 Tax=Aggregatibacter actinomycetemcomitans serotype e str. SC1083 TaxID=907488 RepID=G4A8K1_AGGAC|nr:glycosyltransferase family 2 protein [Aggregatibacter actinomycetemcomitans]EGY33916.1 glycosyl transferase, group 2 family protein [Aggregatibacter actinomycetemcomitans serotype e str. SC1083]KYK73162.1 glycosyl transferase [Aggregatibacter actinomycetemcomitans serotype e str. SA3096]KYK81292.1 glycosyl transferase [Aggregatibacter actinomycetemcomitans serotype e str. SC936]KYK96672.1 glycosyl transferase [Aggregatibacter actinomycetemcomitans serotype e str. ANH9776]TYB21160.1 glycosyl
MQKVIVIIPHYNHSATVGNVVRQLRALDLPVLVVDDGSAEEHLSVLRTLQQQPEVFVHYCPTNSGKGAAMKTGFRLAVDMGFSHAVQVDADGQHHLPDVLKMIAEMQKNPTALICGRPIYSDDAPKARLYGRKITDFWNAIHTLSLDIKDGMCGFRLYPLASVLSLMQQESLGNRMDFDIGILVKAHWHQIPLVWVDTPVRYEPGGISHFRGFADNWEISKLHTRLFFGMLGRICTGRKV